MLCRVIFYVTLFYVSRWQYCSDLVISYLSMAQSARGPHFHSEISIVTSRE